MERKQAEIAARPVKPTVEERKARVDAARQELFRGAAQAIFTSLEAHKKAHGTADLDQATVGAALVAFANLMGGNRKFVAGQDTDALIRFGIDVIAQAAVDAKKRSEDRRIIAA